MCFSGVTDISISMPQLYFKAGKVESVIIDGNFSIKSMIITGRKYQKIVRKLSDWKNSRKIIFMQRKNGF